MITLSVFFRIRNHSVWEGQDGYSAISFDFNTENNPKGLQQVLEFPEMIRESLAKDLNIDNLEDIEIISRKEYLEIKNDDNWKISLSENLYTI